MAIVLTQAEADNMRETMGHRTAHKFLKQFREEMAPGGKNATPVELVRDLTHQTEFEWWKYVAGHAEKATIIGSGITGFFGIFGNQQDSNMHQPRFDFYVIRGGRYTVVRLHPGQSSPGVLVQGIIETFLTQTAMDAMPEWARATTPGVLMQRETVGFAGMHQQDVIGRKQINQILQSRTTKWEVQGTVRTLDTCEILCPCRHAGSVFVD